MKPTWAALCAALVVLATGCGTRVKEWPDGALEPSDYYTRGTATTRPLDVDDDTEGATTATTSATRGQAGRQGSTATTLAGALPAPAPGTYTYDETTSSSAGSEKSSSTEVWTVTRQAGSATLTSTTKEDDDPEFASTTTATYRVTPSKLELLSQRTTYPDDTEPDDCTFKPPLLVLKLPLTVDEKWKMAGKCDYGDGDQLEQELEFAVTGTADDVIGGVSVRTFVVRSTYSQDSTDDTTGERTTMTLTDTRHVDPSTLLTVIEDVKFTFGGESTTVHRQVRSLTPA